MLHGTVEVPGLKAPGPCSRANGLLFVSGQPGLDPATGIVAETVSGSLL